MTEAMNSPQMTDPKETPPGMPARADQRATAKATTTTKAPKTPKTPKAARPPTPPKPAMPRVVTCPICKTTFAPNATAGACPVCGDQVVPAAVATRKVPVLSSTGRWLGAGGWRAVLLILLVLYQVTLFLVLWIELSQAHLL